VSPRLPREALPPPFYTISWARGYDFLTIHLRHSAWRSRLGTWRTHTVTRQSSQNQVDQPLGDIGFDRLLEVLEGLGERVQAQRPADGAVIVGALLAGQAREVAADGDLLQDRGRYRGRRAGRDHGGGSGGFVASMV
jgi:hypothetical protein